MTETWDQGRDPLAALQAGDPAPFEAFVVARSRTYIAYFLHLGASHAEAEDLTQELFLKLFQNASNYETRGRFTAFTFQVARNAWIDRSRRRAVRPREATGGTEGHEGVPHVSRAEDPGGALERRDEVDKLHIALAELSAPQRRVFELGVIQERPYAEISEELGIPVGTVKSRMFNAVRKLREALEKE